MEQGQRVLSTAQQKSDGQDIADLVSLALHAHPQLGEHALGALEARLDVDDIDVDAVSAAEDEATPLGRTLHGGAQAVEEGGELDVGALGRLHLGQPRRIVPVEVEEVVQAAPPGL